MPRLVIIFGSIFLIAFSALIWLLVRIMPFRKDLQEGSTGFKRLFDFINQPWLDSVSPRYYSDQALPYIPWLRWLLLITGLALWGILYGLGAQLF